MSRIRHRWIVAALVVAVLAGTGTWWRLRSVEGARWQAALPAEPELSGWPEEFRARVKGCEERLSRRRPDVDALAEVSCLYLANGFFRPAEQGLRALLDYDSSNARWPHLLASVMAGAGHLEEAVPLWQRSVALAPDYVPARLKLAEALLKTNRPSDAAEAYRDILTRSGENAYARLGLARVEIDAGHWKEAREQLEAGIRADPLFSASYSLLATVAANLGDADAAERAETKASQLGRYKDASDPWMDALVDDCYDVYRLQVIAATIASTGDARAAIGPLQRALKISPENAQTHRQLGKVYLHLRDIAAARAALEKAVALQPTEPAAYLDLLNVYRATTDLSAAFRLLEQGLKVCPQSAGLHFERALALIAEGHSEEALLELKQTRELDPENLTAYQQLAVVNFRLGRNSDAVEALTSALHRNPNFGPVLLMLARYRIQSADAAAAEDCLARARTAGAPQANLEELAQQFYRQFGRAPK